MNLSFLLVINSVSPLLLRVHCTKAKAVRHPAFIMLSVNKFAQLLPTVYIIAQHHFVNLESRSGD